MSTLLQIALSNAVAATALGIVAALTVRISAPLSTFAAHGVSLSLYLALFNMLPVPPLDGSKLLLAARVPMRVYLELARFGFMLLIVVVSYSDVGRWLAEWSYLGARAIFLVLRPLAGIGS